ncbi:MAG: hypothetical protein FWC50_03765 [Planctomycetaceae bacterium]|nr:hypothetical protein [Planctomycetaceae bacterium]
MKKLIALAMMVVCVTAFSMGCTKEAPKKPATPPAAGSGTAAPAGGETTPAAPAEKPAG